MRKQLVSDDYIHNTSSKEKPVKMTRKNEKESRKRPKAVGKCKLIISTSNCGVSLSQIYDADDIFKFYVPLTEMQLYTTQV